jgi:hypothetical protein
MTLNGKIRRGRDGAERISWQADLNLYDPVALSTRQMMMVRRAATDTIAANAISELDTIQQSLIEEGVDRAKDCRAAQSPIVAL